MSFWRDNRCGLFPPRGRWFQWAIFLGLLPGLTAAQTTLAAARATAPGTNATNADPAMQYTRRIWRIQDGLAEDTVQAIQKSQDGYLWIGTTGGLLRFDGSHFHLYNHANVPALADNSVFCILAARDGSLWIGTEGGGLVHLEDGIFRAYTQAEGLSNGFVRSLLEDDQGRIWIGTDNGLFQMVHGELHQVDTSPYTPALAVHAIVQDREHRIWVGGSALLLFDQAGVSTKRLPGRDSENRVKSILETQDGTVWVGTVGGSTGSSREPSAR
jgi:ligand-binding sensor domain-containing protein